MQANIPRKPQARAWSPDFVKYSPPPNRLQLLQAASEQRLSGVPMVRSGNESVVPASKNEGMDIDPKKNVSEMMRFLLGAPAPLPKDLTEVGQVDFRPPRGGPGFRVPGLADEGTEALLPTSLSAQRDPLAGMVDDMSTPSLHSHPDSDSSATNNDDDDMQDRPTKFQKKTRKTPKAVQPKSRQTRSMTKKPLTHPSSHPPLAGKNSTQPPQTSAPPTPHDTDVDPVAAANAALLAQREDGVLAAEGNFERLGLRGAMSVVDAGAHVRGEAEAEGEPVFEYPSGLEDEDEEEEDGGSGEMEGVV